MAIIVAIVCIVFIWSEKWWWVPGIASHHFESTSYNWQHYFFFFFSLFFCSFQWITNKIVKVIYIWMVIQRRSYKSILNWLEYTWTIGWIILDLLCKPNNAFYYIFHFSTLQKMEELKRKWNYPRWTFFDFFSFSRLHRKTIQMEWMER